MYKGCLSSLRKKTLISIHYVGGMKDLAHISQTTGPNMTGLHYGNDSHKGTCMNSIVHLLVLGSLVPGSFFLFQDIFYFLYII